MDVNKSFGSLYNAGIKTVFIVILEMIPGGRPVNQTKKKKRINKYERRKTEERRMLLKAMAVEFDKKKKRSGRMRNELGLPTIYFYFFQSYIRVI